MTLVAATLPSQIFQSSTANRSGRSMLLEGPSGVGKTWQYINLVKGLPEKGMPGMRVLYGSTERKFKTIEHLNPEVWPIKNYDFPLDVGEKSRIQGESGGFSLIDVFDYLRREDHPYDAFYFDSFMRYAWKMLESLFTTVVNSAGVPDTLKAYGMFGRKMQMVFDKVGDLTDASVAKKPIHFIGTWGVERDVDFEGKKMEMPIVGGRMVQPVVNYYWDDVLHLRMEGGERVAYTSPDYMRDAKVSSGLVDLPAKISNPNLFRLIKVLEGDLKVGG